MQASGVMLARCSENIKQETQNISVNALKLYTKMSLKSLEDERRDRLYVKNTYLLLQNVINRKPVLTAAGFFEINYASVFILFTCFTSYLIVLLQFN